MANRTGAVFTARPTAREWRADSLADRLRGTAYGERSRSLAGAYTVTRSERSMLAASFALAALAWILVLSL